MNCLILLVLIAWANARNTHKIDCAKIKDGIVVNGIIHEKEVLKDNVDKPYQLAIDYNSNVLYFSYDVEDDGVTFAFALGSVNLNTKSFRNIKGVQGPFATGVDEKSHSVYIGGSDGIYKLKPGTRTATNIGITRNTIWQLFSKDGLYFTTYPEQEAYLYKNGRVSKVTEIGNTRAILIGVDNSYNIIFSNNSGLFYHTKKDRKTVQVVDYVINSISNDINGGIYFSTPTGIYIMDDIKKEVIKLARIVTIYGAAIERDGSIIYASDNSIIRLKSTGKECIVELDEKKFD